MKYWKISLPDRNAISKLMFDCGITSLAASVLATKNIFSTEAAEKLLNINDLSDPFLIKDMNLAVETLNHAVYNGDKICVYGDYDCDGIMATIILFSFLLEENNANVCYYIPKRSEGYGMNIASIDDLAADDIKLIVTVDNGISAIAEAEYVYELGMKLVITDHHCPGNALPKAEAIVDPHRVDCTSPFKQFCGATIALKLVAAMSNETFALEQYADLAAIATVADIVSLIGENRFIVSYGIELIQNTNRSSLIALKEVSGLVGKTINSHSIGFKIAPRINASSRLGSPVTAMTLMLSKKKSDTLKLALKLNSMNNERKNIEKHIMTEIYTMIDENPLLLYNRFIFLCGQNWHHGVIGIIAAKILEMYRKPCFIASEENGEIRGSARSFGEFSVFSALSAASEALEKFGGHSSAGGFTIKNGKINEFYRFLDKYAFDNYPIMPVYELIADAPITPEELTLKNVTGLSVLEPYGTGNEKPLFYIENAEVLSIVPISGGIHTKLKIKYATNIIDGLMFGVRLQSLTINIGDLCDIIASIEVNKFRDNISIDLHIRDIRRHNFHQQKYFAELSMFETFIRNEKLPKKYYLFMLPTREMAIKIYKSIPDVGINTDSLYLELEDPNINYCRFLITLEAMRQLKLAIFSSYYGIVKKTNITTKKNFDSAPILQKLRSIISSIK